MSKIDLVKLGKVKFIWARRNMPLLNGALSYVSNRSSRRMFEGVRIAVCLHISKETSVLIHCFHSLGMKIDLVAANPLSTKDSIAAFVRSLGVNVSGRSFESEKEYSNAIVSLARSGPELIIDDGGELHVAYSQTNLNTCFGGTDETTSGTVRLRSLERNGKLRYPVIPVDEATTKHLFDNKYGTGQSAIDGLIRATGLLIPGKTIVVAGYGWVGKGVAHNARALGAHVIVTEINPVATLEAHLDGFQVEKMSSACSKGDIFLTCTGQTDILTKRHYMKMRDGAILGNCGHFDNEINVRDLRSLARSHTRLNQNVTEFKVYDKSIYLLSEGRVINLVAAEGHPPEIMQLSFANQLLSVYYLLTHRKELREGRLLSFPTEINDLVSQLALESFGLKIDRPNPKQRKYARSYLR